MAKVQNEDELKKEINGLDHNPCEVKSHSVAPDQMQLSSHLGEFKLNIVKHQFSFSFFTLFWLACAFLNEWACVSVGAGWTVTMINNLELVSPTLIKHLRENKTDWLDSYN